MTAHQIWVTAVVVWLLGLFTAWCLGHAARDRHDRVGRSTVVGHLTRVHLDELAAAREELDHRDDLVERARLHGEAHRAPAPTPPVAVHVHVAAPVLWPPHHSLMPVDTPRFLDAMPVLPAEEVQS